MRVLYRLFVDFARNRQRSPLQSVETEDGDEYERTATADPGPEEQTEAMQQHECLQRAWRFLDGEQQLLLVLQGIEGHSLAEMESLTGIPQGTLKSRLHRARVRLGRLLEREKKVGVADARGSNDELSRHRKSAG
jgi:RNA polymerase sigma-70 factor (ECF subfamily)